MAVYPFYTTIDSSSRKSEVSVGAKSKDATMETLVMQRDNGESTTPFRIYQTTYYEGKVLKCVTKVYYRGELLKEHITNY